MAPAQRASGTTGRAIEEATVREFQAVLRGELLRPGDAGYDAARMVFNGTIDRRPALIARCAGAADVVAGVRFAREHDLMLSAEGVGTAWRAPPSARAA